MISAIINVSQSGDPWPLHIKDHSGENHKIHLEPGQMLWYESAKLPHGRPEVFTGEYYDNIFVHFKPSSRHWWRRGAISWDKGDTPPWRIKIGNSWVLFLYILLVCFSTRTREIF